MTRSLLVVLTMLLCGACRKERPLPEISEKTPIRRSAETARSPITDAAAPPPATRRELTWKYESTPMGPSEVVVLVPAGASATHRFPVVVAFHGRGESLKGPHPGARGWVDDYAVLHAEDRLHAAPLTREDFLGWVKPERLSAMNQSLAARPYAGAILVCPYLPDALHGTRMVEEGRALAHFVVDELLPRVARETPATGTPETTAVDGVSLGGRAALLVGLLRPEAFHAVGALQPAVDDEEIGPITSLAQVAQTKNPGLVIRLLSSDGDYFLAPTAGLHETFGARSVKSLLSLVVGPHSYEFNRGPGAFEMLFFHDRLFQGLTEP